MKDAEDARISGRPLLVHRASSLAVFTLLGWLQVSGLIFGPVRIIVAQASAVGFIWFAEGAYHDSIVRKCIPHRAIAWLALVGLPGSI